MDISTCIITYNQEAYIEKAILGALSQQFSKDTLYEIIISDDCSDDCTSEICRDYTRRFQNIRYIGLTARSGATYNFRETLRACKGRYIAICEGDDYWTDNQKLQKQINLLDSDPEIGLVHSDVNILYNDRKIEKDFYRNNGCIHDETGDVALKILNHEYRIFTCTVCLRREMAEFYLDDDNYNHFLMGDTPLWVEAAVHSGIRYMPVTSAVRRLSSGSLSFADMDSGQIAFFESGIQCVKYIQKKFGYKTEDFNDLFAKGYLQALKVSLFSGDRESFIKYYHAIKDLQGKQRVRHKGLYFLKILSGFKPAWYTCAYAARKIQKLRAAVT
jgi:glycosyltransferase involved in cell wall biosynthesis